MYRLNGNRTRTELIEALARLVRLRLVGQECRQGCGDLEAPYFLVVEPKETTGEPEPQAPIAELPVIPISQEVPDGN
jgi:hypothetical protein